MRRGIAGTHAFVTPGTKGDILVLNTTTRKK